MTSTSILITDEIEDTSASKAVPFAAPSQKVPDMAHSMPTDIPVATGLDNVPRTPRTPLGKKDHDKNPRFYPVVKDSSKRDPQVNDFKGSAHSLECLKDEAFHNSYIVVYMYEVHVAVQKLISQSVRLQSFFRLISLVSYTENMCYFEKYAFY